MINKGHTAKLILLTAACLSGACVSLSTSNSPYYNMVKNDCTGQATLGSKYTCIEGKWTANKNLKPATGIKYSQRAPDAQKSTPETKIQ